MLRRHIAHFDLPLTAHSGQCFRFVQEGEWYRVISEGRVLRIRALGDDQYEADCTPDQWTYWHHYLDVSRDYAAIRAMVPANDHFLQAAVNFAGGLRILRQQPWETLIGFIISQRKNLPAIRGCMEMLCSRFGTPLGDGLHAFPTPAQLAQASLDALNACALGYRSRYILGTAQMIAAGEVNLDALKTLEDEALLRSLCLLPGVGTKVASCVALFAYQRMAAFPRDVWILRTEAEHYAGRFPEENYPGVAGILQQYMFCWRRDPGYMHSLSP